MGLLLLLIVQNNANYMHFGTFFSENSYVVERSKLLADNMGEKRRRQKSNSTDNTTKKSRKPRKSVSAEGETHSPNVVNKRKKSSDKPEDVVEVKIPFKNVKKWKPIAQKTIDFVTANIDSNMSFLLENSNSECANDVQLQFMLLRKGLLAEFKKLEGPPPLVENCDNLKQIQRHVDEGVEECADDLALVEEEMERLRREIDENKSESLRLRQQLTIKRNQLAQTQETQE